MGNALKEGVNIQNYLNKLKNGLKGKIQMVFSRYKRYCPQAKIINYMIIQWGKMSW